MTIFRSTAGKALVHARYEELLADWPVSATRSYVQTHLGKSHVISSGPEDAPPVVLLHGSGSHSAVWAREVAALSETFRVHAVDVIGDPGLSEDLRPELDPAIYVEWLESVREGLGVERLSLVGQSLGGWLALRYAIAHGDRVDKIALFAPSGIGAQRRVVLAMAPLLLAGHRGRRLMARLALGPTTSVGSDEGLAVDDVVLINRHVRPRLDRVPVATDHELRMLRSPVMVVAGARDRLVDGPETYERASRLILCAEVELVAGNGQRLPSRTLELTDFLTYATSRPLIR